MRTMRLAAAAAALAVATIAAPAAAASPAHATFQAGSANYVQGGTSGPFNQSVAGTVTMADSAPNQLSAQVDVTGLAPNTRYVTVAYKDAACLPTPGLTAFPSGAFTTDGSGAAHVSVGVNATSLNPLGTLRADDVKSISIRAVVINGIVVPFTVPNNPFPTTPTIPNVAYVEACDRSID